MPKKSLWLDNAVAQFASKPEYSGKTILKNARPYKMSEILLNFAKPLLDSIDMTNRPALDAALKMAVTVWNYSIVMEKPSKDFTGSLKKDYLESMLSKAFSDPIGESVLSTLLERKKNLYPDILHGITDFEIKWNADGSAFSLVVLTTE